MKKSGFTLIELLIVIMVLSSVGAIVVAILVSTLRGSGKANNLTDVRQNGNYAISILGRMIRNSKAVSACLNNAITIVNPDGGTTQFSCVGAGGGNPATLASNSATLFPSSLAVSPCLITCSGQATGSAQTVTLSFTVTTLPIIPNDQKIVIPFETSIQTRNY